LTDCRYIKLKLLDVVEQKAAGKLTAETATHLENCAGCREMVDQFVPAFAQIRLEPQEVPENLWRKVQQEVNQYEERRKTSIFPSHGWRKVAVASLRSFVILVAAGLGTYLGSGIVNGNPTFAEELADDYSIVLTELPGGSISEAYLQLEWENGGNGQ
jgi:predicted anti-sigma-YlaC factor YlaD